jgi:hypothetical protein
VLTQKATFALDFMGSSPVTDCMKSDGQYYQFSSMYFRLKMFDLFLHLTGVFPNT